MKTKQGKEVNYSDILLYNINKNNIIVIVDDEEQMKKFSITGKNEDAPVAILPYTDETLNKIISEMKQISSYDTVDNTINVVYNDGKSIKFDLSNESIIKSNLNEQRNASQKRVMGTWFDMPDEEKEKNKKSTQKKLNKGLAAALAAVTLAGSLYACSKFGKSNLNNSQNNSEDDNSISSTEETERKPIVINDKEFIDPTDPRKTKEEAIASSEFLKEAEGLYQQTVDKNSFILKYQQVANVKWDKELALEVVEYMNGLYPVAMTFMNEKDAMAEAEQIHQAINLLIAGNLNTETKEEDMIDLSKYIVNEKESVFTYNAMIIARTCVQESIGEPMNGKILDESQWSSVNKFSREYTNSVDQLLHYEFDTMNDSDFLMSNPGVRYVIGTTFQEINATIPQWSHVTRTSSEQDPRTYELYYRYFFDDVDKITYLPEPGPNGTNQYRAYWADEESLCHEDGPYTEDVMFAMAGKMFKADADPRDLGVEVNPNIHQLGIQAELDNRVEDACLELINQINNYGISK